MGFFAFIISIVLTVIGVVLIVFFGRILLAPCFGWLGVRRSSKGLDKLADKLKRADSLIEAKNFDKAIDLIEQSMSYEIVKDVDTVTNLKRHYQGILSRVVIVADDKNIQTEFLPETEHLLFERIDLLSLKISVGNAFSRVQSKREEAGKKMPDWSKGDFETKLKEVKEELADNKKALQVAFKRLIASLRNGEPREDSITYH